MPAGRRGSLLVSRSPVPLDEQTRRRLQLLRRRDTGPERALRSGLHRAGLRFRVDFLISAARCRADIAFPRARIAVFVDGCFWHGCPDHLVWPKNNSAWWREKIEANRRRDQRATRQLEALGWTVVRFWEHEDVTQCVQSLRELVRSRAQSAT